MPPSYLNTLNLRTPSRSSTRRTLHHTAKDPKKSSLPSAAFPWWNKLPNSAVSLNNKTQPRLLCSSLCTYKYLFSEIWHSHLTKHKYFLSSTSISIQFLSDSAVLLAVHLIFTSPWIKEFTKFNKNVSPFTEKLKSHLCYLFWCLNGSISAYLEEEFSPFFHDLLDL